MHVHFNTLKKVLAKGKIIIEVTLMIILRHCLV